MNQKHHEIAKRTWDACYEYSESISRIASALDQADREGYERGVMVSAEMAGKVFRGTTFSFAPGLSPQVNRCILSLLAPPVLVWEHKSDCPTPYQWSNQYKEFVVQRDGYSFAQPRMFDTCSGCGAPKPQETK